MPETLMNVLMPIESRRRKTARRAKATAHTALIGWRHRRLMRLLSKWAEAHPAAQVVQIGSNNGRSWDPLVDLIDSHQGWRAVFVEPIPEHFARLTELRGDDPRFKLVRAAITDHDGEVSMTTVDAAPGMPDWVDGLSSIDSSTVLSHAGMVDGLASSIRRVAVPALTYRGLLESCAVDQVDLLHIDTEGHDAAILDQVDLAVGPGAVLFESKHLSEVDRVRCESRLRAAGYRVRSSDSDTWAERHGRPATRT